MEFEPFTHQEMKMLLANKIRKGLSRPKAINQLNTEIRQMKEIHLSRLKMYDDDVEEEIKEKEYWCSCGHNKSDHFYEACSKCPCKMFEEENYVENKK